MIEPKELNQFGTEIGSCGKYFESKIEFRINEVNKMLVYPGEDVLTCMARSILVYHLRRIRHRFVLGARVGDLECDVLDLETNVNYHLYSGNKRPYEFADDVKRFENVGIRMVVIHVECYSMDIGWWAEYLKKWIRLE